MKKLINALLALALVAQLAVPMTVMAEGEAEATTTSYSIDFSSEISLKRDQVRDSMGHQYFKGQYGKGKDDTSLRVYSLGQERAYSDTYMLTHNFPVAVQGDETNNIAHVSFEYLLEDAGSGQRIELGGQKSDGESIYINLINHHRLYPATPNLCNKNVDGAYTVGTWAKFDVYFTSGTTGAIVFNNGKKYDIAAADYSSLVNMTGVYIKHSHFIADETASPVASAIQYDNFKFEYVSAIPDTQEYRYIGESFNFDDGFTHDIDISNKDSNYRSKYVIKNGNTALVRVPWTKNPSIYMYGTGRSVLFEKGVGGNPTWDTSYHYNGTATSDQMVYRTGVTDLKSGDYGHLTFMVNSHAKYRNLVVNTDSADTGMAFSDGTKVGSTLFEMANDGDGFIKFKFFGTETSIVPVVDTWYKIDMVYKIGNGKDTYTKVDCYVNGQLALADVEVKAADGNYSVLNYIGDINFGKQGNRNFYVDDFGFGVFTADTLHNPTAGYSITANNDITASCIDNTNRVVVLPAEYTVDKFLRSVDGNVTVYNADGLIVTTGTIDGCTVKVSNGFGGGIWYSIDDSKVMAEDNFNSGVPKSRVTNIFNYRDEGLWYNLTTHEGAAVGGLGGKAEDDLALELDEAAARPGKATVEEGDNSRAYVQNADTWKSQTVVLEGSFLLKSEDAGLTMQIAANKLNSYLNYVIDFRNDGLIRTMFAKDLEEKWEPNRWYKVAAVMDYGSTNIEIYLNGDLIWDGDYRQLASENVEAFIEGGSGFEYLSRIRFLYDGQVAMDNIRVSYGAYDPSKDKIELSSSDVAVNNEKSIIGFDGGVDGGYLADDLLSYFDGVDMQVYADSTLTAEAEDITDNTVAVVSKGEAFKYYEMGYKTKQLLKPEITYIDNNLTATAVLEETALKTEDSTAALMIAVYGEKGLETVMYSPAQSVVDLAEDLTASIPSVDMLNKTAKAFLWNTASSMIPLYDAVDFELETVED